MSTSNEEINSNRHIGTVTDEIVDAQMTELNNACNLYDVLFAHENTSYMVDDAWAVVADSGHHAAKAALHIGNYGRFNLYFHICLTVGILGACTLPLHVTANMAESNFSDGCTINAHTMLCRSMTDHNLGKIALHGIGH